jgi:hypothetical protein
MTPAMQLRLFYYYHRVDPDVPVEAVAGARSSDPLTVG